MTFFIISLATINIAIGYALAVYLGHGQLPWRVGAATLRSPEASPSEESAPPVDRSPIERNVVPAVVDEKVSKAVEQAAKQQQPIEKVASPKEDKVEQIDEVVSKLSAAVEATEATETTEDPAEVESADEVATIVENAAVADTEEVAEAEPLAEPSATSDESLPEQNEQQPTTVASADDSDKQAGGDEKVDEKFLEGIAAFQNQLGQSKADSTEEVETETAQAEATPAEEAVTETAIPAQEESSIGDDVLAGIESFRAQLADMQQKTGKSESGSDSETSASEAEEQPVG